jgi:predicted nucleic acid-binding protein
MKAKGVSIEKQAQMIRNWLNNPYIVRRTVHSGISDLAREIASKHGVKGGADATIIATAVFDDIRIIHTYDAKMQKLHGKFGNPPIRIMAPDPAQGTMWAKDL